MMRKANKRNQNNLEITRKGKKNQKKKKKEESKSTLYVTKQNYPRLSTSFPFPNKIFSLKTTDATQN